jgi:hypothetical protein
MLYVRYVHLTKTKHIRERQTHPVVRDDYDRKSLVQLPKKNSGRGLKGLGAKTNRLAANRRSQSNSWLSEVKEAGEN